jgi:TM2 domain-containing membrane protein YozV
MTPHSKSRTIATLLALVGLLTIPGAGAGIPLAGWHLAGLHKFYLGQPRWGVAYLLLSWTPIPIVACLVEGIWYLSQGSELFDRNFNDPVGIESRSQIPNRRSSQKGVEPQVTDLAEAVRQLDALRAEGLISEYEFEQKRRQLLDRM